MVVCMCIRTMMRAWGKTLDFFLDFEKQLLTEVIRCENIYMIDFFICCKNDLLYAFIYYIISLSLLIYFKYNCRYSKNKWLIIDITLLFLPYAVIQLFIGTESNFCNVYFIKFLLRSPSISNARARNCYAWGCVWRIHGQPAWFLVAMFSFSLPWDWSFRCATWSPSKTWSWRRRVARSGFLSRSAKQRRDATPARGNSRTNKSHASTFIFKLTFPTSTKDARNWFILAWNTAPYPAKHHGTTKISNYTHTHTHTVNEGYYVEAISYLYIIFI